MVQTNINTNTGNGVIILKPNNSATWSFNMKVLMSLGILAFFISMGFLMQGLWMILPFSGLELLALFSCLYFCVRENIRAEVITFTNDKVIIEQGRRFAEKSWEYHRLWAKIFVGRDSNTHQPRTIVIRSHGRETELGSFLNGEDKDALVKKLHKLIYPGTA